jgi:polyphosphate kinase
LKALVGGAAPDEIKALRRLLLAKPAAKPTDANDLDAELGPDWCDRSYPYKNPKARCSDEAQNYLLQVERLGLESPRFPGHQRAQVCAYPLQ